MNQTSHVKISLGGENVVVERAKALEVADQMHAKHGGVPLFEDVADPSKIVSDFGGGNQIVDVSAKARIVDAHAQLKAAGVSVDANHQLYATGTRMAQVGYDNQAGRKAEHDKKQLFAVAAEELRSAVLAEKRADVEMSAADFGRGIEVNGKITVAGYGLSERAIRGLTARLESPALRYVLGLRERIAAELFKKQEERDVEATRADRAKIADVLRHECMRNPSVALKLRTRQAPHDVFAVVSPDYTPADAPAWIDDMTGGLPAGTKGSWAYDPTSTSWELRAEVWTPTPIAEQAVGEPFEGYMSLRSKDNGTGRARGGGGIVLLACLNAGTYSADGAEVSRMHRSNILVDVEALLKGARASIDAMCAMWGAARTAVVEAPVDMKLEDAIPGFWRYLLRDRRSELAAVLPGRTENNVELLSEAYFGERRNRDQIVRADFAQGWTKMIQSQPTAVRRDAEIAIGNWLEKPGSRLECQLTRKMEEELETA